MNTQNEPFIDLAFSSKYCHSFIVTAPASTFAFWMNYLSKSIKNTFYNVDFLKDGVLKKQHKATDYFLPNWIPLHFNRTTCTLMFANTETNSNIIL